MWINISEYATKLEEALLLQSQKLKKAAFLKKKNYDSFYYLNNMTVACDSARRINFSTHNYMAHFHLS